MKLFALLLALGALTFAADSSTPEQKERIVKLAKQLEENPADSSLIPEREWAVRFLIEAPDIHVKMCGNATEFLLKKKKYKYGSDLMVLATIEGGRYDIENPGKGTAEQALAMVQGVLKAYEELLKSDPKAQLADIDAMLAKRNAGELERYIQSSCSGDSKSEVKFKVGK